MEDLIPKKRKRSFSLHHPFMGIFTRSKSQIYLHRNRSGRARSDSFRHHKHNANIRLKPSGFRSDGKKRRKKSETTEISDDWSSIFIKDLRARRVFSLGSMPDDCGLCADDEEKMGSEKRSGEIQDPKLSPYSTNLESLSSGSFVDKEDINAKYCLDSKEVGEKKDTSKSDVECSIQEQNGEISAEECVQATPPDSEILQKISIEREDLQDSINKKDANKLGPKSVISPRSRVRVFKAPGSFSYRRLLPYLMDMVQDNSSVLTKGNCLNIENQPISTNEFKVDGNSMEAQAADSMSHDMDTLIDGLSDNTDSNLTYAQHNADSPVLSCSQKYSCTMVSSLTSLDDKFCSKQSADDANEKIKKGLSCKDGDSESLDSGCSLRAYNPCINGNLNESRQLDGEENGIVVSKSACNGQDATDTSDLSWMAEKRRTCSVMQNGSVVDVFYTGHNCKTINPNLAVSYVSGTEGSNTENKSERDVIVDKIGGSNEVSTQMIQPDVDILYKPAGYQNVDRGTEFASKSTDQVLGKPLSGNFQKNKSYLSDKSMDSSCKRKLGLSPRSMLKLFKTRSSFSYRRLLPYLMDIAKDNSGDLTNGHCLKLENGVEENLLPSLSMPNLDETPAQKLEQNTNSRTVQVAKLDASHASGCDKPLNTNSCTVQVAKLDASHASGCDKPLKPSNCKTEIPPSVARKQEPPEMQVMKLTSENEGQTSAAPHIVNIAHGSSPGTTNLCSSLAIPKSCDGYILDLDLHESLAGNIDDNRTSGLKLTNAARPAEADCFSQNSSKLEDSGFPGNPASCFKKGILKRNPRGCRGPCTCLNCASFRLHAERAFEFSKNQMQDAEEIALCLINELSRLRNMLDKASSCCNDNLIICTNQVKEACRKASEAEEVAKSRLNQMNYDLEVHCRITDGQRPRVKFANNVEERIIS